jgi:hypothetical protein
MTKLFRIAIALLLGIAFCWSSFRDKAYAEAIKGGSHDRKMTGSHGSSGGGGAGAPRLKQKRKLLNPQPEPPGRR